LFFSKQSFLNPQVLTHAVIAAVDEKPKPNYSPITSDHEEEDEKEVEEFAPSALMMRNVK